MKITRFFIDLIYHVVRGARRKKNTLIEIARYFWKSSSEHPPVIIYQMGKVASSTLRDALYVQWPGITLHTHRLHSRDFVTKKVYEKYIAEEKPVLIISLVREPIARNISAFFQNYQRETGENYKTSTLTVDELKNLFFENYPHNNPLQWFDNELHNVLGIDVYESVFPVNGVQVIQHKNIKLLILRVEIPDSEKLRAVREFLQLPEFSFTNKNIGTMKKYSSTYRQFKKAFIAPDWYIDRMYNSKYFNHFYNNEMKEKLIEKWTQIKPDSE